MPNEIYDKINWKNKTPEEKRAYWAGKTRAHKLRNTGREVIPRRTVDYGIFRECFVCKEKKELNATNFYRNKSATKGFQTTCKLCATEDTRRRFLAEKYGVSPEEYAGLLKDARCEICFTDERLVLDHCHEHGHIRAVLCHNCNTALGLLRDDPDTMTRAIEYLHRHRPGA